MLNIKNPRAHELAAQVAAATGESLTRAVIHSLEERLARVRSTPRIKDPKRIAEALDRIAAVMPPSFFEHDDPTAFLYDDETGLPR